MLRVPAYELQNINVYNFRNHEWNEETIIDNINKMLVCGEDYGLRIKSVVIKNKEEKETSEVKRTKSKILDISLAYTNEEGTEDVDLSYDLPWLLQNHFFISGNWKVCVYQLFDKPVIKRPGIIKIRTNIQSIMLEKKTGTRRKFSYEISLFGKKFAFAKLLIAYLGIEQTKARFTLNENNEYTGPVINEDIDLLIKDITAVLNDVSLDKARLLETYFPRKVDAKIIEDVLLITKIDIFSKKYFNTDNVIEEFLFTIQNDISDDSNYANKRIRFE